MDWGLIGIILAIVFFIAIIVLTLKLSRKKKPVWASITNEIIGLDTNAPAELKLSFNDKPVRDVYRTKFIFFNKGREPIRGNDVVEDIAIHFKGADILQQPVILKPSKEAIKFSAKQIVKQEDNAIELSFSYLDHNDGAVVEVLHTKSRKITHSGTIVGADSIDYIGEFLPPRPSEVRRLVVLQGVVVIIFGIVMWSTVAGPASLSEADAQTLSLLTFTLVGLLIACIFGLQMGIRLLLRYRKFPDWSDIMKGKGTHRLS